MDSNRKGIILAGGLGTRLHPITRSICKQLLPIYDKPMIYYPLCTLMLSKIREILIITNPGDIDLFKRLLGNGSQFGISISYKIQESPKGIADAFLVGKEFINNHPSALVLGDNIFYGHDFVKLLADADSDKDNASLFTYSVNDPERFGVAEFDSQMNVISIEEKPKTPKSNFAVTGLYFYDQNVVDFVRDLKPSRRGELEITDLNNIYILQKKIRAKVLGRGFAWLDTGTFDSLIEASSFIATLQNRQGFLVSSPEEIAYKNNWINSEELLALAKPLRKTHYGKYLEKLIAS